jgi:hypothetical protein
MYLKDSPYQHSPFNLEQKNKLHTEFLSFIGVFKICYFILKNHFQRAFLRPYLYQLAVLATSLFLVILSLQPIVSQKQGFILEKLQNSDSKSFSRLSIIGDSESMEKYYKQVIFSNILDKNVENLSMEQIWLEFSNRYLGVVLALILVLFVTQTALYYLDFKQILILNDYKTSIWQTKNMGLEFTRWLIFLTASSVLGNILTNFTTNQNLIIVINLLFLVIVNGFFGLAVYLFCLEKSSIAEALKNSSKYSIKHFLANCSRWFNYYTFLVLVNLFLLIIFLCGTYLSLVTLSSITGTVFQVLWLLANFIFLGLISAIFYFVNLSFRQVFGYVSFYNLRFVGEELPEVEAVDFKNMEELEEKLSSGAILN